MADAGGWAAALTTFGIGGRLNWHKHDSEQILFVTEGRGIVATKDEEHVITAGCIVYIPAGENHWHGATPESSMTHLNIQKAGIHLRGIRPEGADRNSPLALTEERSDMKAAVCYEFGKPLVIEELSLRPPRGDEVKVRVAATAICHSDIHDINGDFGGKLPFVGGHETAGRVEEVGAGVRCVKPGDPVIASLLEACGTCFYCTTGMPYFCGDEGQNHVEGTLEREG